MASKPKFKMTQSTRDKDLGYKRVLQLVGELGKSPEGAYVNVGFLGEDSENDARKATEGQTSASNLEIAVWNEFGTPHAAHPIPERAFMRTTADKIREEMTETAEKLLHDIAFGLKTVPGALKIMGLKVQSAIRKTIRDWSEPANAPSTIKAKGVDNPLEDTGQMRNAVEFDIHYQAGNSVKTSPGFNSESSGGGE